MVTFDQNTTPLVPSSCMETNIRLPEFDALLDRLVSETERRACRYDRREDKRQPFPYLVNLIPIPLDAPYQADARFTVIGRDISRGGFRFYHTVALPLRKAILCLPWTDSQGLLIQLRWCRFLQPGWYESGSNFLGATSLTNFTGCN